MWWLLIVLALGAVSVLVRPVESSVVASVQMALAAQRWAARDVLCPLARVEVCTRTPVACSDSWSGVPLRA